MLFGAPWWWRALLHGATRPAGGVTVEESSVREEFNEQTEDKYVRLNMMKNIIYTFRY